MSTSAGIRAEGARLRPVALRIAAWTVATWMVVQEVELWPLRRPTSLGHDSWAYWLAWRQHLYGHDPHATFGRYLYSPAFAEVIRPLASLPWPVFAVLWSSLLVIAYAWLLAPLRWEWWIPLFLALGLDDILLGNVHALLAVMLVLSLRYPTVWAFALLTKPPLGVGLLWFAARRDWRRLGAAIAATAALVLVSLGFGPNLWAEWLRFLVSVGTGPAGGEPLYVARLAAAVVLILVGARRDRRWLLPVAFLCALPMWTPAAFGVLAAIPRLRAGVVCTASRPGPGQRCAYPATSSSVPL